LKIFGSGVELEQYEGDASSFAIRDFVLKHEKEENARFDIETNDDAI
jgi:hypothetical protein